MRKQIKKIAGVALAAALVLGMTGCSMDGGTSKSEDKKTESESKSEDKAKKIGLSLWAYDSQYWTEVRDGAQEKCDELGYELVIADPNNVPSQQVSDIENFITMKVDAIIVAAIDPQSVSGVLKEAREAGIKVVAQSIEVAEDECDVYSSADEYQMGEMTGEGAGNWIVENFGDEEVECAVLNYDSNPSCIPRGDGMEEGITKAAPKAKVVARQDASTISDGQSVTDSLLQANPNLKVIVCQNDAIALGAYSAVQAAGKDTDDFYIGGIDNTDEGRQAIAKGGAFRATLDIIARENGYQDVEICEKLLSGDDMDWRYVIEPKLVTYDDVKEESK